MTYPLVTDLAADGVPVAVTCRVLGFSKQGYYRWKANPVAERDWIDAHLVNAALDIHADDPAFGYRFIADELPEKGITAGENRVQRLCRDHGIWSVFSKKRGLNRKPGPPVHDDLVERDFTAAAPNELWLTDITEHPTEERKLYLCAVKDVYSGRIVGYSMDARMKSSLAVSALENAVRARRRPAGTVVHSDRGSQGVFNRSKQHLITEVLDVGSKSSEAGTGVSRTDPFTGSAVGGLARGPGTVLGRHRFRCEDPGRRRRGGRVRARGASLVPARWRCESSAGPDTVRAISVLERP